MWITAWILVAYSGLGQPTYPPFQTQTDCETARTVYLQGKAADTTQCIQVTVFQ
jgi:hypothetical protein